MHGSSQAISALHAEEVQSNDQLQEALVRTLGAVPQATYVGVVNRRGVFQASTVAPSPEGAFSRRLAVGCFAKTLTATLAAMDVAEGRLAFEDQAFDKASLIQLLSHTHGYDASGLASAPHDARGLIDSRQLEDVLLSTPRIGEPGSLYSYGSGGSWVVAALLEKLHGCSYRDLLVSRLLTRLEGVASHDDVMHIGRLAPESVCAATAGALTLSFSALLGMIRLHLGADGPGRNGACASVLERMRSFQFPVEGWSSERAVCPGWKYYGGGWFGHWMAQGEWNGTLRIQPERGVGIVLTTDSGNAFVIQSRLFASMPDLQNVRWPRPLFNARLAGNEIEACSGTYGNSTVSFEIAAQESSGLVAQARATPLQASEARPRVVLKPCGDLLFVAVPPSPEVPLVIAQFLRPVAGRSQYLWNGREMLPRLR